jgi:hypothetical protein
MATSTPLRATRRLAPDASRTRSLLRRWGLALRFVAICLAAMLMLAALQGASCALSAAQRYCVEVPISMFYALHAGRDRVQPLGRSRRRRRADPRAATPIRACVAPGAAPLRARTASGLSPLSRSAVSRSR